MNSGICAVLSYCFVNLAINSVVGLRGRDITAFCSFRTGSAGGLGRRRSDSGFDRLSPQELKDFISWISFPGIFDGLSSQQLMEVICSGRAPGNIMLQITKTPFKFGYKQLDLLQMDISFELASDVTGGIVSLRYNLTDHQPKRTFTIRRPYDETDDPVVHVRDFITDNRICLNGNRCQFGVDLRKKMKDKPFAAVDLVKNIQTIPDAEKINKPTCTNIYFISLTIFAIAFCVLVIVAFIKRCWMKRDAPEILQVPLQPRNPFYVNLLFRKECQEMIDDLEQNHYELID